MSVFLSAGLCLCLSVARTGSTLEGETPKAFGETGAGAAARRPRLAPAVLQRSSQQQGRPTHAKPELLRFFDPRFGLAQTGNFCKHVYAILCKASEASPCGVRGLPRPPEASLMGFRGLPRPREASTQSQNPFNLKDYGDRGL